MKYTTTLSSISCFLTIFFLAIHSTTAEQDECYKYLCDEDWEYVKAGQPYRFGPPRIKNNGDISLEGINDAITCPRQAVVLEDTNANFIFNPIVPDEKGRVPLETAISISSADKVKCEEETGVLQMKRRSEQLSFWHITADGKANTSASCYQFIGYAHPSDPAEQSYWLQNCPYMCGRGTPGYCQNVGSRRSNSKAYLSTSRDPYELTIRGNGDLDASI